MSTRERDERFLRWRQAAKLGPLALYRLRAEVLLERLNEPVPMEVTEEDREELVRIASAPHYDDWEFLGRFDISDGTGG